MCTRTSFRGTKVFAWWCGWSGQGTTYVSAAAVLAASSSLRTRCCLRAMAALAFARMAVAGGVPAGSVDLTVPEPGRAKPARREAPHPTPATTGRACRRALLLRTARVHEAYVDSAGNESSRHYAIQSLTSGISARRTRNLATTGRSRARPASGSPSGFASTTKRGSRRRRRHRRIRSERR